MYLKEKVFDNMPLCGRDSHYCVFSLDSGESPPAQGIKKEKGVGTLDTHLSVLVYLYSQIRIEILKRYMFYSVCTYRRFTGLSCSKRRKHLEEVRQYWKEKAEAYYKRSDEGADTDSQNSLDHGVQPTDTTITTHQKKSN